MRKENHKDRHNRSDLLCKINSSWSILFKINSSRSLMITIAVKMSLESSVLFCCRLAILKVSCLVTLYQTARDYKSHNEMAAGTFYISIGRDRDDFLAPFQTAFIFCYSKWLLIDFFFRQNHFSIWMPIEYIYLLIQTICVLFVKRAWAD